MKVASAAINQREEKIEDVATLIETNLTLIGKYSILIGQH